ncbi:MAG: porin family protein [Bacteroidia bacterium]
MNNENLNDFYKQNRFNKKLRERIDSYEPELSDSLWDRIEHGLEKKESRSKRMVWMVYVMAGLLLISGAGLYYLASENKKLAEAVKTKDQLTPKGSEQEAPAFEYNMPETTIEVTPGPSVSGENPETEVQALPPTGSDRDNPVIVDQAEYTVSTESPLSDIFGTESTGTESEIIAAGSEVSPVDQANTPMAGSIESQKLRPFSYRTKPANARFLKEVISTKGLIYPKVQPYIGLTSEVGSTRQKVEGSHAYRFNHEHPLLYRSAGLKTGILLRNGLFIETGLAFSNTGSNLWYGFERGHGRIDTLPIPAPTDSLVAGNRHAVNQQYWMDIPMQIGYRYRMNSLWSLQTQVGLTYSMINSYQGLEPNESFAAMDMAGESVPQPFQNFWSMNVGLGIGYQFGRNWMVDIQGNYRRGLTNMNSETRPNHPNRRAEYLNAKVGIAYIFR